MPAVGRTRSDRQRAFRSHAQFARRVSASPQVRNGSLQQRNCRGTPAKRAPILAGQSGYGSLGALLAFAPPRDSLAGSAWNPSAVCAILKCPEPKVSVRDANLFGLGEAHIFSAESWK